MVNVLGYFRRGGIDDRLYSPQMVRDFLGGCSDPVHDDVLCVGGGECHMSGFRRGHRRSRHGGRVCVFSGELLNQAELQSYLGRGGVLSSSEVCLLLFERLGEEFAKKLSGSFLLVIYDQCQERLWLYRDHIGQHPVYYSMLSSGHLLFGDDLNQVVRLPGCSSSLDLKGLFDYLSLGYVPAPETIYHGVRKLRPGCYLSVRHGGRVLVEGSYWRPQFVPKRSLGYGRAVSEAWSLLDRSVERCRRSHPGCGIMLSGGLDSNILLALSSSDGRGACPSYTAGFSERSYDERGFALESSRSFGVENHSCEVCPSDCDVLDSLESLSGEPFGDSSLLPTVKAMSLCGRGGHVLTGSGGDEFFGGYRRYQAMSLRSVLRVVPSFLLRLLSHVGLWVLPGYSESRTHLGTLRRFLSFLGADSLSGYGSFQEVFSEELRLALLSDSRLRGEASYLCDWHRRLCLLGGWHSWAEQFNLLDAWWYLPDDGCRKEWLASRYTGVGKSSPLLDPEVMEFGLRLPSRLRFGCRRRKAVLSGVGQALLGSCLTGHRGKLGFGVPVSSWFRGALRPHLDDLCLGVRDWDIHGWFSSEVMERLRAEHLSGHVDHGARLWVLWCLRSWLLHH